MKHALNFIDLTGKRFGHLTVLEFSGVYARHLSLYKCRCDCGRTKIILASNLRQGKSKSCGCNKFFVHGHTINYKKSTEYRTWESMIARCNNPKRKEWKNYGMLGVIVCERWKTFKNLLKTWEESHLIKIQLIG